MKSKPSSCAAEALRAKRGEIAAHIESMKTDAATLRRCIGAIRGQRDALMSASVSKDEYINLVCQWVDSKAKAAAEKLAAKVVNSVRFANSGEAVDIATAIAGPSGFSIRDMFTLGMRGIPVTITDDAIFLFFADAIKDALRGRVADAIYWPFQDTCSLDAAKAKVASIDTELEALNAELAALVELGESFGATV